MQRIHSVRALEIQIDETFCIQENPEKISRVPIFNPVLLIFRNIRIRNDNTRPVKKTLAPQEKFAHSI